MIKRVVKDVAEGKKGQEGKKIIDELKYVLRNTLRRTKEWREGHRYTKREMR